jgi:Sulfotransferase family
MLVFIHINKTAGSTVRYILRSSYGARHCDVEPWGGDWDETPFSTTDLRRLRKIYPNLASIAGHRVTGYADLHENGTEFTYFTFLRDPLKLCASRFQYHVNHRKKKGLVFEEWIQRDWLRNAQTKRIAGTTSAEDALRLIQAKSMFVGLTERFDESMVLLRALRANDLNIGYTPVNVARNDNLARELLTKPSTRAALVEANQADLELYEYVQKELYPRFVRDYGPGLGDAVEEQQSSARQRFDRRNVALYRLKRHGLYRPVLRLYRWRKTGRVLGRVLG